MINKITIRNELDEYILNYEKSDNTRNLLNCPMLQPIKTFLFILTFIQSLSMVYGQSNGINTTVNSKIKPVPIHFLTIDTFSYIPPDVEGCTCFYSNDSIQHSKRIYIYAANLDSVSYLKINGVLTKFSKVVNTKMVNSSNREVTICNDLYEIIIHSIHGKPLGDEVWEVIGTITLKDKFGNIVRRKFYGDCGC